MAGGRPTRITKDVLRKLEEAFIKGLNDREACLYADIWPSTLYDYCRANPKFSERKELLKEQPKMRAKLNVSDRIDKHDIYISTWYLERKAKDEFSAKHEIDVQGEINNPFAGMSAEDLKKLIHDD